MSSAEPPQPPRQASPATPPEEGNVLTKADIKDMATKTDIAGIKADIVELKADTRAMKWMLGSLLAVNVAIIVSIVTMLVRLV